MGEVTVWFDVEGYGRQPGDSTQVRLSYDTSRGCVTLPERFTATQNGRPLTVLSHGQWSPPSLFSSGGCGMPVVTGSMPDPSEELTTFVFSDGEETIVAEFRNPTTPLSLRLREPQDGVLRPGQTAVVEFFPSTDLLSDPHLTLIPEEPQLAGLSYESVPRREGSTFIFTVPLSAPPGPAKISLQSFTFAGPGQCTQRCVSRNFKQASLPVTVGAFELPAGKVTP
jgi:hypothetical protein